MSGAFFLGAEAVGGHITAMTSGWRFPAILAQGAHLAAAAMWVGGLAVLAYAAVGVAATGRPAAWRTAAAAFRPVAGISAAVVIATGVIASVREVEHRYFLVWSAYGRSGAGAIVLGSVFDPWDLLAYLAGVTVSWCADASPAPPHAPR